MLTELKHTILQGKCDIMGHKITKSEYLVFESNRMNSLYTYCIRCQIPLKVVWKNGKVRARVRY
jgi:hypothetical protein